jgi:hypothetical protein
MESARRVPFCRPDGLQVDRSRNSTFVRSLLDGQVHTSGIVQFDRLAIYCQDCAGTAKQLVERKQPTCPRIWMCEEKRPLGSGLRCHNSFIHDERTCAVADFLARNEGRLEELYRQSIKSAVSQSCPAYGVHLGLSGSSFVDRLDKLFR